MNVLLVWPIFPRSYWSFDGIIKLAGKKALMPPLGVITTAAMFPQHWSYRLVDKNVRDITPDDWAWADVVMLSSMIVQKPDFIGTIEEAKKRGLPVVVGGPYVTSVPQDAEAAGADYIVMDEGEVTIPLMLEEFLQDPTWRRGAGEKARRYTALNKKPEMHETPVARYDLLDMPAYDMMSVQYSRGCPFLCEFCDIINLYGRVPRTKPNERLLTELQTLYDLGWRGGVFLVDDNFIGNKKNVKGLLYELRDWQQARGNPFHFDTEASLDLAADDEMLDLMVDANFVSVFMGVETPDVESLELTRKHQNNRTSMADAITKVQRKGMRVMAGFIIGFDGEKQGAGDRIWQFIEQTNTTHGMLSMLQVLPNTGLFTRLTKEGRLRDEALVAINQDEILNFVPTRPSAEIATEFLDSVGKIYDPVYFMGRAYRYAMEVGLDKPEPYKGGPAKVPGDEPKVTWQDVKNEIRTYTVAARLIWRQGVARESRKVFWKYAWSVYRERPEYFMHFLVVCAHNEHFIELTAHTTEKISAQIPALSDEIYVPEPEEETGKKKRAPAITTHMAAQ